ncbi:MAG: coproporphyrinogen dehydrogenase HemZ [Clostridiales bacterium]|nr:coproporphyrinogen dehydrogenase HemZ [Clostridiales bacterium]
MKLYLNGHNCRYASEQMLLTMFPDERPEYPEGTPCGDFAELDLFEGEKRFTAVCRLCLGGKTYIGKSYASKSRMVSELTKARLIQRIVKLSFYRAALASGKPKPVWGALTGIRPGKLLSNLLAQGMSDDAALSKFCRDNDVSRDRARLCLHTAHAALSCADNLREKDVCLYIGIPFCPTRCAYCSFVSQSVEKSMKLIPDFLDALYCEIEATAAVIKKLGLRPVSIYVGGGTPTTLSAEQLDTLFSRLESEFCLSDITEITVEAGRPDTIAEDKLEALKRHGVTRISVNPQTMDDKVLEAIGRRHTAQDVLDALQLVRSAGGFQVNMDLIAGLPADSPEGFAETVRKVLDLSPENITVHTLALKKGSAIMLGNTPRPSAEDVGKMIDFANSSLVGAGYEPYYLYRQKYMSGGFENVGWQRGGTANIYNICIMEELCSIISMGGGASTKLCLGDGRIERIFDPKYPLEYIERIDKIISDKQKMKEILLWHTN